MPNIIASHLQDVVGDGVTTNPFTLNGGSGSARCILLLISSSANRPGDIDNIVSGSLGGNSYTGWGYIGGIDGGKANTLRYAYWLDADHPGAGTHDLIIATEGGAGPSALIEIDSVDQLDPLFVSPAQTFANLAAGASTTLSTSLASEVGALGIAALGVAPGPFQAGLTIVDANSNLGAIESLGNFPNGETYIGFLPDAEIATDPEPFGLTVTNNDGSQETHALTFAALSVRVDRGLFAVVSGTSPIDVGATQTIGLSNGSATGKTATYGGQSLSIDTQDETSIVINSWPDLLTLGDGSLEYDTAYDVMVTDGGDSDTVSVVTNLPSTRTQVTLSDVSNVTDESVVYAVRAQLSVGDILMWEVLSGTLDGLDTLGYPINASEGAVVRAWVYSGGAWGNPGDFTIESSGTTPTPTPSAGVSPTPTPTPYLGPGKLIKPNPVSIALGPNAASPVYSSQYPNADRNPDLLAETNFNNIQLVTVGSSIGPDGIPLPFNRSRIMPAYSPDGGSSLAADPYGPVQPGTRQGIVCDASTVGRNGTGRALQITRNYFHESVAGGETFHTDNILGLILDQDYEELFVEFWLRFSPNAEAPFGKAFRIGHTSDPDAWTSFFPGGNGGPIVFQDFNENNFGCRNFTAFRGPPDNSNTYYLVDENLNSIFPRFPANNDFSWDLVGDTAGMELDGSDPQLLLADGVTTAISDPNGTGTVSLDQVWGGANPIWRKIQTYVKMNSAPGEQDGVWMMWVDDALISRGTTISWIPAECAMLGWNFIALGGNTNWGYNQTPDIKQEYFEFDEFKVYSSPQRDVTVTEGS